MDVQKININDLTDVDIKNFLGSACALIEEPRPDYKLILIDNCNDDKETKD